MLPFGEIFNFSTNMIYDKQNFSLLLKLTTLNNLRNC